MFSLKVSPQSLVCRPCRNDVTRVLANSKHTPRWAKNSSPVEHLHSCCVRNCGEAAFVSATLASAERMKHAYFCTGTECGCDEIPVPTPLCKYYYYIVYDAVRFTQRQCATCYTWLKYATSRACPKPDMILKYLKEHRGFEGHQVVLQNAKPISKDSYLSQLLSNFSIKILSFSQVANDSDVINRAMGNTLVMVGNLLSNRQAILLPCIHDQFTTYVREIVAAKGFQETHVTSRRILSELTANFQHHIAFSCKCASMGHWYTGVMPTSSNF